MKKIIFLCLCTIVSINAFADNGDILFKKNFGGIRNDLFTAVTTSSDAIVAVGHSDFESFGTGNWEGVEGKGNLDAIIIKYDFEGNILWRKNFGGEGADAFEAVVALPDGFVAVGYSSFASFGAGDWTDEERKGWQDAIVAKFDLDGNIVWKHNLGGKADSYSKYNAVAIHPNGIVAAGSCDGIGGNDWEDIAGKGSEDAIIVSYNHEGEIIWKKNFGGAGIDRFLSISTDEAQTCIVAVGVSSAGSFKNGDWEMDSCKGGNDAIMVKFDMEGNIIRQKNFGGAGTDIFYALTAVEDGFVAVGISFPESFGNGDWAADSVSNGWEDAIIVIFDSEGEIVWNKHFGGNGWECFYDIAYIQGDLVAVGAANEFNSGDWANYWGRGNEDAIIARFDINGKLLWKKVFGGKGDDCFNSLVPLNNGIVTVGYASFSSFGTGDMKEMEGHGWEDALIVHYEIGEVGVNEIKELIEVRVYPNPTSGELRMENGELRINNVEVYDVMGRKQEIIVNYQLSTVNCSHLPAGIYFLSIHTDKGIVTQKIIKN